VAVALPGVGLAFFAGDIGIRITFNPVWSATATVTFAGGTAAIAGYGGGASVSGWTGAASIESYEADGSVTASAGNVNVHEI
jgi:hypothetical protein